MINAVLSMFAIGGVLGVILGISSKLFFVEEDTRVADVTALLPGYNCGGCGYPGCSGLAVALVEGTAKVELCKPAKADKKQEIKEYLEANK
ncbi:MAG: (Fe-S)-binding protein [Bacillota bacterium]|jgi:electron transport complex protein RnfB|nr:(Fe-S)-binding protein [Bacillota bacterium]